MTASSADSGGGGGAGSPLLGRPLVCRRRDPDRARERERLRRLDLPIPEGTAGGQPMDPPPASARGVQPRVPPIVIHRPAEPPSMAEVLMAPVSARGAAPDPLTAPAATPRPATARRGVQSAADHVASSSSVMLSIGVGAGVRTGGFQKLETVSTVGVRGMLSRRRAAQAAAGAPADGSLDTPPSDEDSKASDR